MVTPAAPFPVEPVLAGGAIALVMIGAATALLFSNVIKRVAGLLIAGFGALGALAVLGAPDGALVVGVAILFAYTATGAAIVVRLQEAYGSVETLEIDAADAEREAQDRAA